VKRLAIYNKCFKSLWVKYTTVYICKLSGVCDTGVTLVHPPDPFKYSFLLVSHKLNEIYLQSHKYGLNCRLSACPRLMETQPCRDLLGCECGLTKLIIHLFLREASTILLFHRFRYSEYLALRRPVKQHACIFIKYIHISLWNILGT